MSARGGGARPRGGPRRRSRSCPTRRTRGRSSRRQESLEEGVGQQRRGAALRPARDDLAGRRAARGARGRRHTRIEVELPPRSLPSRGCASRSARRGRRARRAEGTKAEEAAPVAGRRAIHRLPRGPARAARGRGGSPARALRAKLERTELFAPAVGVPGSASRTDRPRAPERCSSICRAIKAGRIRTACRRCSRSCRRRSARIRCGASSPSRTRTAPEAAASRLIPVAPARLGAEPRQGQAREGAALRSRARGAGRRTTSRSRRRRGCCRRRSRWEG